MLAFVPETEPPSALLDQRPVAEQFRRHQLHRDLIQRRLQIKIDSFLALALVYLFQCYEDKSPNMSL